MDAINIIFDGPPGPGPEAGRFMDVETDDGKSINTGGWIERPDGLWALRIPIINVVSNVSDTAKHEANRTIDG